MSDSPKKPTKCCEHCQGTGRVEVTGIYYETWLVLSQCKRPVNGVDMAANVGCSFTAMHNRLSRLEKMGLATSERYGPYRFYKAVIPPTEDASQQVATPLPAVSQDANIT